MAIELDLRVEADPWQTIDGLEQVCLDALEAAANLESAAGEVSLLLTSDPEIQTLNATWRGKDKPTDVLSFPADPMDAPFLGDIAVSFGVAQKDAETQGKTMRAHLQHLLVHGLLHLLGHDHEDDTEAEEMERLERLALASIGVPDPYSHKD